MSPTFKIGERELCRGRAPYVAAEIGVNFDGDLQVALRSIDAAAAAGADAAKFQTFRADEFMAGDETIYEYQSGGATVRESMRAMFKRLELPAAWHSKLADHCRARGVDFLSSGADPISCDLLASCGVPAIKLASEDLINRPLLRHVAGMNLPVILSTGMADGQEIDEAVEIMTKGGGPSVMLLHCVSLYPTPDTDANLRRMVTLAERYGLPVGYSDHTTGTEAAVAAVALGALFIEKHFTLDRAMAGPDHAMSADPTELADLVSRVQRTAMQLGGGALDPGPGERRFRLSFRRSIVAARDIRAGDILTADAIALKRPGTGLHPREADGILGRRAKIGIPVNQMIKMDDLD